MVRMEKRLQQIRRIIILTCSIILASIGFQLVFTLIFGKGYTLGPEALIVLTVLLIATFAPRFFRHKKERVN